jgi:hypothetical protein
MLASVVSEDPSKHNSNPFAESASQISNPFEIPSTLPQIASPVVNATSIQQRLGPQTRLQSSEYISFDNVRPFCACAN